MNKHQDHQLITADKRDKGDRGDKEGIINLLDTNMEQDLVLTVQLQVLKGKEVPSWEHSMVKKAQMISQDQEHIKQELTKAQQKEGISLINREIYKALSEVERLL